MARSFPVALLVRLWLGTLAGLLAGMLAFGLEVFRPDRPAFRCVTEGALLAVVLALVRLERAPHALLLVVVYGPLRGALTGELDWPAAIAGLLGGLAVFLVGVIFDLLARMGIRFGKFLVVGPLVGVGWLAVAPVALWGDLSVTNAVRSLMFELFVGLLLGDGVGLGVELAELALGDAPATEPDAAAAASTAAPPRAADAGGDEAY